MPERNTVNQIHCRAEFGRESAGLEKNLQMVKEKASEKSKFRSLNICTNEQKKRSPESRFIRGIYSTESLYM